MDQRIGGWPMFVIILTQTVSGCVRPEVEAASFSAEDAAAVRTNLETYMRADPIDAPETFFGQFAEDVHWIYSDQPPWVGMQGLHAVEWCHTRSGAVTAERVEGAGDLAYARGTYRLSLDCGGEEPVHSEGAFLSAHRRQQDGSWRIESLLQH